MAARPRGVYAMRQKGKQRWKSESSPRNRCHVNDRLAWRVPLGVLSFLVLLWVGGEGADRWVDNLNCDLSAPLETTHQTHFLGQVKGEAKLRHSLIENPGESRKMSTRKTHFRSFINA